MSEAVETVDFGGLSIAFDDRVLRPRPWTTAQSRWAAELLPQAPEGPVLELCTGAGQIGLLTAAFDADRREVVLVDVEPAAGVFAQRNAEAAGLSHRVEVRVGAMESALARHERFAAVLADPPWVPTPEVHVFPEDPRRAIDGGADGLDLARQCVDVAARHLLPQGWCLLQVGTTGQAAAVGAWGAETGLHVVEVREHGDRGVLVLLRQG